MRWFSTGKLSTGVIIVVVIIIIIIWFFVLTPVLVMEPVTSFSNTFSWENKYVAFYQ